MIYIRFLGRFILSLVVMRFVRITSGRLMWIVQGMDDSAKQMSAISMFRSKRNQQS